MQTIGRYEVLGELGQGAMGVVFRAKDPQLGRVVAIKIIRTANASPQEIERYKLRFHQEAQAAGRMAHPGIVTIHDIAEDDAGQPYLVMEFVEGTPLDRQMAPPAPRPSFAQVLEIGIQIALALDYAHKNGVVHRDIKPANILVTSDGRTKIADFGVAKLAGSDLTQEGHSVGTPSFMSPEQFRGSKVDARSDMFSFGAVLYWMATGEKPFPGETVSVVSFKIAYEEPVPAREINRALPEGFETILSRCLAKNPENRYESCADVAADLEALRSGGAIAASPAPSSTSEQTQPFPLPSPLSRHAACADDETTKVVVPVSRAMPAGESKRGAAPKRTGLAVAAVVLAIAIAGAAYWFWPRRLAERPATPSIPVIVTVEKPAPAKPNQNVDSAASAPAAMPAVASMATLQIDCVHNFKSAALEILVDGKPFFEASLDGKKRAFGFGYKGEFQGSKPIPAGEHNFQVHVLAAADKFDSTAEISGAFEGDGSKKLVIEFGKGSGVGMGARKLTLSWH
jgi:serine/threonine-protein kinase